MRFYGSIRLPFFKVFSPRIGFVTDRISLRKPERPRYTSSMVDGTTLTRGGSAPGSQAGLVLYVAACGFLGLCLAVYLMTRCDAGGSCHF